LEDQGKDAASAYVAALQRHPGDHTLLHNFAQLRAQSDPSAALELYERALDADPEHAETLNSLGKLLCSIGDHDAGECLTFNRKPQPSNHQP
jgi:Tfp pilus assembly protein PilF